jgi:hypothetical protein
MGFRRERLPDPVEFFEGQGLQLKGPGKWKTTRCEFHGGSDSMRVNTDNGAWCCMNCGAKGGDVLSYYMQHTGEDFVKAAKALRCFDDDGRTSSTKPLPFSARQALEVLRFESLLCVVAACNLAQGVAITEADRRRLTQAAQRIETIAGAVAS